MHEDIGLPQLVGVKVSGIQHLAPFLTPKRRNNVLQLFERALLTAAGLTQPFDTTE